MHDTNGFSRNEMAATTQPGLTKLLDSLINILILFRLLLHSVHVKAWNNRIIPPW